MSKKICPIMSRNFLWANEPVGFGNTSLPANEDCFVECQNNQCALWVTLYNTENSQESGCAFALNAMKNSEGMIVI
jgi:hypothetical protein